MRFFLTISFLLSICAVGLGQSDLPRGFAPHELSVWQRSQAEWLGSLPANALLSEPTSPLRAPAEWEELQAIVITWAGGVYAPIQTEIVRHAREECTVIICVRNANEETNTKSYLQQRGVDIASNVQFVVRDFNTVWVRDFGPNACYTNDIDSLVLVDWVYNRPRPKDDTLSYKIASVLQVPVYSTTTAPNRLVHTGGNFMSDGLGLGFSSDLVLHENPNLSEQSIDRIMQKYHGLQRFAKMDTLPYDDIHHIDMHMKIIDEETLLVGEYPAGRADGPQIEANLQYILGQYQSAYGRKFKVVRIQMPPDGSKYPDNNGRYFTYANAIIVNKTVLVPTYGIMQDSVGLQVWRTAMPGYKVVGINCINMIGANGALHCITKEIGVQHPIWITYPKIQDIADNTPGLTYPLTAQVKHKFGLSAVKLFYKLTTATNWNVIDMVSQGNDLYTGEIPHVADGSIVAYYVEATAMSGKKIQKPLVAPNGFNTFEVKLKVSTQEPHAVPQITVFPNPANAIACIHVASEYPFDAQIRLFDALGRQVQTIHTGTIPSGDEHFCFQSQKLQKGVYFIEMITQSRRQLLKLVVE